MYDVCVYSKPSFFLKVKKKGSSKKITSIKKKMIDDVEVDRKFCNYCTIDFLAKTSSGNLKNHLREHKLFKKRKTWPFHRWWNFWNWKKTKLVLEQYDSDNNDKTSGEIEISELKKRYFFIKTFGKRIKQHFQYFEL